MALFARWCAANAAAGLLTGLTLLVVSLIARDNWFFIVAFFVCWVGFGMLFGTAQWLVPRNRWGMSRWWLALSSILGFCTPWVAFLVGGLSMALFSRTVGIVTAGAVAGAIIGGVQLLLLDPPPQRRLPWILGSAGGVALAVWSLNGYMTANIQSSAFGVVRDGGMAGAIYGVITGFVLLLLPPPGQRPAGATPAFES